MSLMNTHEGPFDPGFDLSKLSRTALAALGRGTLRRDQLREIPVILHGRRPLCQLERGRAVT